MERIINCELLDYLVKHVLITKDQFGFMKRRSTCANLLESLNDWVVNVESKLITDVLYIDFRKAFDSVSHNKLLIKLKAYGIDGNLIGWIASFLSNRTQVVRLNNCLSNSIAVTSGVPQGTVLGPTLFLIFINDIADIFSDLNVTLKLFADDVKLYSCYHACVDNDDLDKAIIRLIDWSNKWQLRIANEKCLVLRIYNSRCKFNIQHKCYNINNCDLPCLSHVRDLGITVDSNLNFNQHISLIVHKAHQRANLILKCFQSRDRKLLLKAFCTYVRPLLEYCTPVWSPHHSYLVHKVEGVQRSFTKRIHGLKTLSYIDRLDKLAIDSLERRRLNQDLLLCYKLLHNLCDSSIAKLFKPGNAVTRGNGFKLAKLPNHLDITKYFYLNRVIDIWNSLPCEVVSSQSLSVFKSRLRPVNLNKFLYVF